MSLNRREIYPISEKELNTMKVGEIIILDIKQFHKLTIMRVCKGWTFTHDMQTHEGTSVHTVFVPNQ